jgi:hypothetical protein
MVASAVRGREESRGARSSTRWTATASPETTRKSPSTFVDAAFPLNKRGKRFGARLVLRSVPQQARPLGSGPFVDLLSISGRENDGGEWFVGSWQVQMLQLQRPARSTDRPIFCRPPHHKIEHGAQLAVDRIAIPAGSAILPSNSHPEQVLPQPLRAVSPVRARIGRLQNHLFKR